MNPGKLKKLLANFTHIPVHPQWLLARSARGYLQYIAGQCRGTVLDIGCGRQEARGYMQHAEYIGLDYYRTAAGWYGTFPDIYATGEALPVADKTINHVLLLDVLEHIPDVTRTLSEVCRVLKHEGTVYVQVPFIYPLHDKPLDFHRWTEFGLRRLFQEAGLDIREIKPVGTPVETAAVMFNLGLCNALVAAMNRRHFSAVFIILLPVIIPLVNLCAVVLSMLLPDDGYMPYSYRLEAARQT